jgi:hypothetical protein
VVISSLFKVAEHIKIVDALSAQCDGDVLPTKLRPVKIEDGNEND